MHSQRWEAQPLPVAPSPPACGLGLSQPGLPHAPHNARPGKQGPPHSRLCLKVPTPGSRAHLLLLLPGQLHLLLLLLQEHRSHVLLLRVRSQELVPQSGQLVDHD